MNENDQPEIDPIAVPFSMISGEGGMEGLQQRLMELLFAPKMSRGEALRILVPILDAGIEFLAVEAAVKNMELNNPDEQMNLRSKLIGMVTDSLEALDCTIRDIDDVIQGIMDDPETPFRQEAGRIFGSYPVTVTEEVTALFPQTSVVRLVPRDDAEEDAHDEKKCPICVADREAAEARLNADAAADSAE